MFWRNKENKQKEKYSSAVRQLIHDALKRVKAPSEDEQWSIALRKFISREKDEPDIILEYFFQDFDSKEFRIGIMVYDHGEYDGLGPNSGRSRPIHERDTWLRESVFEDETTGSNYRVISRQAWIDEYPENRRNILRPPKPERKLTR